MGGAPGPALVDQVSVEYTSTKSIFTFDVAGKVTLTVTFLSPVYPDDMARQSQQFSYVSAKAKSADGNPHSVQVYMDVSGGMLSFYPSSIPSAPRKKGGGGRARSVPSVTLVTDPNVQNGPAETFPRLLSGTTPALER